MSQHNGPRGGTRAFKALEKLQAIGGTGSFHVWMNSFNWSESILRFQETVVDALVGAKLVLRNGERFVITDAGLEFLGIPVDQAPRAAPLATGARYSSGNKPLDVKRHFPARLVREGSLSFRDIPSLIGGARVEFAPGIPLGNFGDQ
ncbi:hypothetical protein AAKU55_005593 [Oxalobacteraceae bacterium GrIS 1.11]